MNEKSKDLISNDFQNSKLERLKFNPKCLLMKFRCNNCSDCCKTDSKGTFKAKGTVPCVNLQNGKCSIYQNRPIGCATFPLSVNKAAKGYSVVATYLRQCGYHKNGKIFFHENTASGFNHPEGNPLYLELKNPLVQTFGEDVYSSITESIHSDPTKPVFFLASKEYLEILSTAEKKGNLNRNFVLESPGTMKDSTTGKLISISASPMAIGKNHKASICFQKSGVLDELFENEKAQLNGNYPDSRRFSYNDPEIYPMVKVLKSRYKANSEQQIITEGIKAFYNIANGKSAQDAIKQVERNIKQTLSDNPKLQRLMRLINELRRTSKAYPTAELSINYDWERELQDAEVYKADLVNGNIADVRNTGAAIALKSHQISLIKEIIRVQSELTSKEGE
jgi:hypothetical protein